MFWRFLFLFGGIVLMINGCNGLVSGQFGTHKLRVISIDEVAGGLGDADYVEVTGATIPPALIVGKALNDNDEDYYLRPALTSEQAVRYREGKQVAVQLILWSEGEESPPSGPLRGLLSEPTARKNPLEDWASQRIIPAENVIYLQINERPLAWYWNLLMFIGGLGLAIGAEAFYNRNFNNPDQ